MLAAMAVGCGVPGPPRATREAQTYNSVGHQFSVSYPANWVVETESDEVLVLIPAAARAWHVAEPSDIPKDPRVRLDVGSYVRERLGPANFPATLDATSLKAWLEQMVKDGTAHDLVETTIDGVDALQVTELYDAGCERVVYWRPANLQSLVRVSTGCESPYLDEFQRIVDGLRELE